MTTVEIKDNVKKVQCDLCFDASIWIELDYVGAPDQWFKVKMEIDPSRNDNHIENYQWDVCPMCIDPDQKTLWGRFVHRWKYIRGLSTWRPRPIHVPEIVEPSEPTPHDPTPMPDPNCKPRRRWFQRFKDRRAARRANR